tara:strand:- start:17 stop:706 length:690 start_codon:yes stop_codon:yes gene_type:complete
MMVIPIFYENLTVVEFKVPHVCNWQVVIDWGGVKDKTAALLMSYEFNTDTDLVYEEKIWDANTSSKTIVDGLKEWDNIIGDGPRWADVAGQTQVDLQREYDYTVSLPQKTKWLASVNSMATRFATKNVKIRPNCKFLIASIKAGMFNKQRTDFDRTIALGHMDALAALMYGIRCQNRENPYLTATHVPNIQSFVSPEIIKSQKEGDGLDKLSGKTFGGGPRKFGSFVKK